MLNRTKIIQWVLTALLLSPAGQAFSDDGVTAAGSGDNTWPAFLGQGASPIDAGTIPVEWSFDRNIAWKVKLPEKDSPAR